MLRALALSTLMLASLWAPAMGQSEPMLGATLTPTSLSLRASERRAQTQIQNLGNVPVTVTADALLTPALQATGWRVKVKPSALAPGEWATVTLSQHPRTPLSDVTLSILMGPQTRAGMDSTALRFPVPVTVEGATPQTTVRAWMTALWTWVTVRLGMADY